MTAIAIPAPSSRTRLRTTARGRRVLACAAALPLAGLLALAVLSGGSAVASRDSGGASATFATVTVTYGDTLWSIAQSVAPQHDPRDVVDAIARLNALPGGAIELGQSLAIPAEYAPAG
ncbi:LysM peptidoglycan-binding domain-containing protein [Microbacterium sp. NPDC055357]